jgi:succinyl-diaminopimelate desuccinylase
MSASSVALPVGGPLRELVQALVDSESPSGAEASLADAIEAVLSTASHLEVLRLGNTVAARTNLGRARRVIWAGHIDTVQAHNNLPSEERDGWLWGRGSVDMKAGVAVGLKLAIEVSEPLHDVTWIFYDNEEVDASKNGLGLFGSAHPEWVRGDLAIVGEPTNGAIEAGCNGTLRVEVSTVGVRAHSARSWMGRNAIHEASGILARLEAYQPAEVDVDGLVYREGLNAVGISGGVAGNVIPDLCTVTINYRFAPDKSIAEAIDHVSAVFEGFGVAVVDQAAAAKPGLSQPLSQEFVSALGIAVGPKYGWTDVARFSEWGIPALNYGPGDPSLAHADDERVDLAQVDEIFASLSAWLSGN